MATAGKTNLRRRLYFVVTFCVVAQSIVMLSYMGIPAKFASFRHFHAESEESAAKRAATILFWNRVILEHHREYTLRLSDEQRCHFTNNHSALADSQLVVVHFHGQSWWGNGTGADRHVPPVHPAGQEWVFLSQEPPTLTTNVNPAIMHLFGQQFNATATYMTNSDIDARYGYYFDRQLPLTEYERSRNYAANRSKLVVWLSSHCGGSRAAYVSELNGSIPVDIYGGCGMKVSECSNKMESDRCLQYLSQRYKFYVAFENSDCDDYITEKLWRNALSYGMVPIVRGKRSHYDTLAPPGSYVAADWFSSAQQLAEYLLVVNRSDALYNQYFAWKQRYQVYFNPMFSDWNQNFEDFDVQLCKYAHQPRPPPRPRPKWHDVYKEMVETRLCT